MKLLTGLALVIALGASAHGLQCYSCATKDVCVKTDCGVLDRCFKSDVGGLVTKGCMMSNLCVSPISCCEGDLCNSAPLSLPSVLLLGLTAFITLYLNQD